MDTNKQAIDQSHYDQMIEQIKSFDPNMAQMLMPGSQLQQHLQTADSTAPDKNSMHIRMSPNALEV